MKRTLTITIILILLIILAAGAWWYFFLHGPGATITPVVTGTRPTNGFTPFGTVATGTRQRTTTTTSTSNSSTTPVITNNKITIPSLRLLSNTPVGGYSASTSASTTVVRWIDRGRGDVFEVNENSNALKTLSNTVLPKMYKSVWNKNLNAFVGYLLSSSSNIPTVVYAELKKQTASSSNLTPFQLKGKNLPDNIIDYAVSPAGNKIFMLVNESGTGAGYIANFDGTSLKRLFDIPFTQVSVDWPETNIIAITTKGGASSAGYLYFINATTGSMNKIIGPVYGLSTKVSHDAQYVLFSYTGNNLDVNTSIYNVKTGVVNDAVIRTLADKCAWGNFYKTLVYCGTPSEQISALYPDDWYTGAVSTIDKIWQVNAASGEVHLVSSLVDQSDRVIDTSNLVLDPKDNYLLFTNKDDLSLWSLDLVSKTQ